MKGLFCQCHPSRQANHPWGRAPMFPLAAGVYKFCLCLKFHAKAKQAQTLLSLRTFNALFKWTSWIVGHAYFVMLLYFSTHHTYILDLYHISTVTANDVGKQRFAGTSLCDWRWFKPLLSYRKLDGKTKKDHAGTRHVTTITIYRSSYTIITTESLPHHRSRVLGVYDLLLVRRLGTAPSWCNAQRAALWRRLSAHDGHLCLQPKTVHVVVSSLRVQSDMVWLHLNVLMFPAILVSSNTDSENMEHRTSKTLRSATFSDGKEVMSCAPWKS